MAVVEAICDAPEHVDVAIATDSKLVIGWLARRWRCRNRRIARMRGAFRSICRAKDIRVRFVKVKAHGDDCLNALVDLEASNRARGIEGEALMRARR